jgi:enterochelin esterase-like enzyme
VTVCCPATTRAGRDHWDTTGKANGRRWLTCALVVLVAAMAGCDPGGRFPTTAAPTTVTGAALPTAAAPTTVTGAALPTAATPAVSACAAGHGTVTYQQIAGHGGAVRLAAYLPPCALDGSHRRYRTLYLLHGANTDETQWPAIGLARTADELIAARAVEPLIVVMPGSGLDPADSSIADVVVPWADANLPTSASPADRAIGGISAGAAGALRVVAQHPAMFSRVGGHSPVVDADPSALGRLAAWDGAIWLDAGQDDGLRQATESAAATLAAAGARVELHIWAGQHNRAYWGAHVGDYLRFYAGGSGA